MEKLIITALLTMRSPTNTDKNPTTHEVELLDFLSEINLRLESTTPDVGALHATIGVDSFNVDQDGRCTGCGYDNPDVLIPRLMDRLDLFTAMFARVEAYDAGAEIPPHIAPHGTVKVFWPATEEVADAVVVSVDPTACTAHVKWCNELETTDLCVAWILPAP